jgi:predicted  nucleic acid-binding Zn-ribbon protein
MKNRKQSKKEITTDDLAIMVQKGFLEMNDNFNGLRNEFKTEVGGLKTDVGGLKADVSGLKNDVKELKEQTKNIENKINQIDRRLFSIEEDVADIKIKQYGDLLKRVSFIERKMGITSGR